MYSEEERKKTIVSASAWITFFAGLAFLSSTIGGTTTILSSDSYKEDNIENFNNEIAKAEEKKAFLTAQQIEANTETAIYYTEETFTLGDKEVPVAAFTTYDQLKAGQDQNIAQIKTEITEEQNKTLGSGSVGLGLIVGVITFLCGTVVCFASFSFGDNKIKETIEDICMPVGEKVYNRFYKPKKKLTI